MVKNQISVVVIKNAFGDDEIKMHETAIRLNKQYMHNWPFPQSKSDVDVIGYVVNDFWRSLKTEENCKREIERLVETNKNIANIISANVIPNIVLNTTRHISKLCPSLRKCNSTLISQLDYVYRIYNAAAVFKDGMIHVDSDPLSPFMSGKCQYAFNFYIDTPEKGGELFVWPSFSFGYRGRWILKKLMIIILNICDYIAFAVVNNSINNASLYQDNIRKMLNHMPCNKIKINRGDIVILNQCRFHAVNSFPKGFRTTAQFFVKFDSEGKAEILI